MSVEYLPANIIREPTSHHIDSGISPYTPIKPRLIRHQSTPQTHNDSSATLNNSTVAYSETDVVFMHYPEAEASFTERHTDDDLLFGEFDDNDCEHSGGDADVYFNDEYDEDLRG